MYLTESRARGSLVVLHLLPLHTQLRSIFTETDNPIGYSPAVDVAEIERGRTWDNKDARNPNDIHTMYHTQYITGLLYVTPTH